jgi:D-aminopeptidase
VAETWDGYLNDINGFHVKPEDADAAMNDAHGGPVAEGNVGGGTGMVCNEFKGGIGTSSRRSEREVRRLHGRSSGAMQLRLAAAICASPAFR